MPLVKLSSFCAVFMKQGGNMEKFIISVSVLLFSFGFALADANTFYSDIGRSDERGDTTYYYNKSGKNIGRSDTCGDITYYYDGSGLNIGRSDTRGDTTYDYDKSGRNSGRSDARGNTTYHYDKNGR